MLDGIRGLRVSPTGSVMAVGWLLMSMVVAVPPMPVHAQQTTIQQPDCQLFFTLTVAGSSPTYNNLTTGCSYWSISLSVTGFSGATTAVQSAPNNNGSPGSWATFGGTTVTGTNPSTSTTSAYWVGTGFYPFMRVNLSGTTGSGKVQGTLYGWRQRVVGAGGGGGSPGGTPTQLQYNNTVFGGVPGSGWDGFQLTTPPLVSVGSPGANLIPSGDFTGWLVTGPVWAATNAYNLDDIVVDAAFHTQKVTTAGTSGGTIPTFDDMGGTTSDGSVTWTDQGIEWTVSAGVATHTPVTNAAGNAAKLASTVAGIVLNDFYLMTATVDSQSAGTAYFDLGVDCNSDCSQYFTIGSNKYLSSAFSDSGTVAVEIQPSPDSDVVISNIQLSGPVSSSITTIVCRSCVALGAGAASNNTTGLGFNALGAGAAFNNTTGSFFNALGLFAAFNNTSGSDFNALGYYAATNNTTGSFFNALGLFAAFHNTTGHNFNALGNRAAFNSTTGHSFNAIGTKAAFNNTTGLGFNALGTEAAFNNTTGTDFVALGDNALRSNNGSNNIAIGSSSCYNRTADSNLVCIDSIPRANAAADLTDSWLVGHTNATPANQTAQFNASLSVTQGNGAANTVVCWKTGGVLGWASNTAGVIGTTCN